MAQDVIYARVPPSLKKATDAYAAHHGVTLTAAVADLLERGLAAASDSRSTDELDARLRAAEAQLATLTAFAARADHRVGDCPKCSEEITGRDLLAVGSCPHCSSPLSELIVPSNPNNTLDQREALMLVGALGAVLAVAYLASKK
ncbi:hypothetical protein KOI35_08695 [Actinoplanes bogorensis]|uniref:CopG family transcriptional regulator n=1 Tax=Paractinoplanes bogorensis TaxID=1610840 RepID=A0ABS5YJD8_9ACTN|nr:hypothetical protein [Actinoplanes bogorensis]MBU2663582.1 hypothetical protein [Actinoplanes bogorensis]